MRVSPRFKVEQLEDLKSDTLINFKSTYPSWSLAPEYPYSNPYRTPIKPNYISTLERNLDFVPQLNTQTPIRQDYLSTLERNLDLLPQLNTQTPIRQNYLSTLERNLDFVPQLNTQTPIRQNYLSTLEKNLDLLPQLSTRQSGCTCFVFYLPTSATNNTLIELFSRYAVVLKASVAFDKITGKTRGFGFVDLFDSDGANLCVSKLDGYPIDGKFLSVSIKA